MTERFLLVALGTEPGGTRQFPIIDLHDKYHRPYCWVDTWTDGVERVAFLNRAAALEHLAAEVDGSVSVPRQGVKGVDGERS